MRQLVMRLHIVLAILVAMLAAGQGLPGLVLTLHGPATHVCTCASGGDHQSCPVCNPSLTEHRRSSAPAARPIPCGDSRVAVGALGDVSTLPAPLLGVRAAAAWVPAPRAQWLVVEQVIVEPTTPPPRAAVT
jgi:hypothetical protein